MNSRLIIFNVVYYAITLIFFFQGRSDPSSSLGYGFYIFGFWILSAIVLTLLVVRNRILITGAWNKIGLFLATPILFLLIMEAGFLLTDRIESEWYTYKNGHQYKIVRYGYRSSAATKRTEIYKSREQFPENAPLTSFTWLRDSTWTFYSQNGDTIKTEKYKNNNKVE